MTAYFPNEVSVDFYSFQEFQAFLEHHPWFLTATTIENWVQDVMRTGFQEPVTLREFKPNEIKNETDNFREGIVAGQLNSRQRAMLHAIKSLNAWNDGLANCEIYGLEQVTTFAERVQSLCTSFVGSEYLPSEEARRNSPHLRHEDLMNLSFPASSFDVVFSNDVLEHVPDIDRALSEVCRILRPNGSFVSTFPFRYGQYESEVKASLEGSQIVYHVEPEYHGNPVDPDGSLVFEVPGWDILDRAIAAGYRRSFIRLTASKRHGFIGTEIPAVFIAVFEK